MGDVGIGQIGAGFVANLHAEAFKLVRDAELRGVASTTPGSARAFAARHEIPGANDDYRRLLEDDTVDIVSVAVPNFLHHEVVLAAASAGKHVICEKPL